MDEKEIRLIARLRKTGGFDAGGKMHRLSFT